MTSKIKLSTLSDLKTIADKLPVICESSVSAAKSRQMNLTKPPGSLGRLEELAIFIAGWRGIECPQVNSAQAVIFAGNHGICAQGVNPYPQEVTAQMVANFNAGGAAINQLCKANGAELTVIPLDLNHPTADFTQGLAMTEAETIDAINKGAASVNSNADILILGEMGIGNSTVAAALASALFGGDIADWVGPGTGSDATGIKLKCNAVKNGLKRHTNILGNAPQILAALGGREQAAICGALLAARAARIPVILDGFICTAAAAVLYATDNRLLDHCIIGHTSPEPGHQLLLSAINKKAVLNFDMRLGEGSGAAVALGIIRSALACHNGMATFGEAGISEA